MHSRPDMRDSCTLPSTGRCMLPGIVPQIRAKGHSPDCHNPRQWATAGTAHLRAGVTGEEGARFRG